MPIRALRTLAVILACCLLSLAAAGGIARAEQAGGTDYRDIFLKANEKLLQMKSYHATVDLTGAMTLDGKDMNASATCEIDLAVKPMLMRNAMTVAADFAGKHDEFTMTQYAEEVGDKMTVYTQLGPSPKWIRQLVPNLYPGGKYEEVARKNLDYVAKAIANVTLVRETDEALVLEVTFDFGTLLASVAKDMVSPDGKKLELPEFLFAGLKDMVETVEVDKKSLLLSSASFDLTPVIASVGEKLVETFKPPASQKAMIMEILGSLKVQGSITFSRYNAITPIVIPFEARNAPLAPTLPGKPDAAPPAKQPAPAAASDGPIKIGANLELTGPQATFGQDALQGAKLAVKEINEAGGVLGRKLELAVRDNASTPAEAASAAAFLISQDRVVAIVGAITSTDTLAAAPLAEGGRVPLISPSATNPRVTAEQGQVRKYVFRAAFIDPYQGKVMSRFAVDVLRAKKAAVIVDESSDYSKGVAQVFETDFRDRGGAVVVRTAYLQRGTDFGALLQRIRDAGPDVIFVPGYYQEVGSLIRQARELGITAPILGGDGWDSPRIVGYAGAEALNDTYFCHHFSPQDGSPLTKKFVAAYGKEYGRQPGILAALGYDTVQMVAAAVKKAGEADPEKIRDALEKIAVEGVTGRMAAYDAFHNPQKAAVVIRFVDGKQTFVQRIDP